MADLAIRGHETRGKEVIELLEMLGGRNTDNYRGTDGGRFYFVDDFGHIDWCHEATSESEVISFTLEDFLEKYPYKVGDKVQHRLATSCGTIYRIAKARWECDEVKYIIYPLWRDYGAAIACVDELKPWSEEETDSDEIQRVSELCEQINRESLYKMDEIALLRNENKQLRIDRDFYRRLAMVFLIAFIGTIIIFIF